MIRVSRKEATCTEEGNIEYWKCSSCNKLFSDSKATTELKEGSTIIIATGHTPKITQEKKATCTVAGYSGDEVCSKCGKTIKKGAVIPATGHKPVTDHAIAPTTTSTGLTEGSHCSVCGDVLKKQEVIPKKAEAASEKQKETRPAEPVDPNHPAVEEKDKQITSQKNDGDPKGSAYGLLCAKVKKSTKTSNGLAWNRVAGANGYIIYGNQCGTAFRFVKLAEVQGTSYTHKNLKKGTYYKYLVVAYKNTSGNKTVITTSKTMHAATIGGKVGNCKKLKLNKGKVTLKRKKSFKIKAKEIPVKKKLKIRRHRKIAFESSNPKIATVTRAGKIKGLRKGSCKIYVYAQNGVYKVVKVKVK